MRQPASNRSSEDPTLGAALVGHGGSSGGSGRVGEDPWYPPPWYATAVAKHGRTVYYDERQPTAHWFSGSYATWEPGTFGVLERFATDQVVLDIGAWVGPTVLWEAHVAKRVVALEPTPAAYAELRANLDVNPEVEPRVVALRLALDAQDGTVHISNRGNSTDRVEKAEGGDPAGFSATTTDAVSIDTLCEQHPDLEKVGFVKMDTEGHEQVLVPALEAFFRRKRPVAYVSLHPMFIGHEAVQRTVDRLAATFPFLYEADMRTPFDPLRGSYTYGEHGGADVVGAWAELV